DDPDSGNVYQDLTFPERVYESISSYNHEKSSYRANGDISTGQFRSGLKKPFRSNPPSSASLKAVFF
ncbi:MAG: hypothetical protein WBA01_06695, partial [Phormidesmis sp.]